MMKFFNSRKNSSWAIEVVVLGNELVKGLVDSIGEAGKGFDTENVADKLDKPSFAVFVDAS